ncbi:hypothetical protein YYC_01725 [Plasmodium yoelii 17X]|uniref:Uncharacterized protein n=2 Tax=Plasmodium yoelii TaxID=5861 RepID=Q7RPH0_PLAYO|nr:hypothetical protein [Plasmodium yoelii yoelii]ETB61969.1 hypothetical protein YYC_01725 [Plasmodium yoelii 17X]
MVNKFDTVNRKEEDIIKKLNYKNINDVRIHELNSVKSNRRIYLKKGSMFFLSSKEEALKSLNDASIGNNCNNNIFHYFLSLFAIIFILFHIKKEINE